MAPEAEEGRELSRSRSSVSVGGLITAGGWLALLLAVISVVGQRRWPVELITHFWPQLLVTLLCSSLVACLSRSWRSAAAHGAGGAVLLVLVGQSVDFRPAPVQEQAPDLTALFVNVERSNTDYSGVIGTIRTLRPHVVALAEIDDAWLEATEVLRDDYPHRIALPRDDNFGIALLSRLPLQGAVEFIGPVGLPSIVATVRIDSVTWRIVVTHPIPPFNAFAFDSRNEQFAALAEELAGAPGPTVLLGDLNATLWSPYLRDLQRTTGLRSASSGLNALYTWPTGLPILALGLDHCLYSEPAYVVGYHVLASVGSDHFPILCELSR